MKKSYPMVLGCAACAAKMEKKIAALPGVTACSINFMTARLNIETDEASHAAIMKQAAQIVRRIEPQAVIKA